MAANGKLVCVTGASGYIASWLVKRLLSGGYTVNATLRNPNDPNKVKHLKALEGAEERLNLFEADLLKDGTFDSAIHGCHAVFHTASPVLVDKPINDPQIELIEPAVKGTLNVLSSCAKTESVKRVVLTSSMATVIAKRLPQNADVLVDETWSSDPLYAREIQGWYVLSKILAEEAAIKFSNENGIDLVVLNPGLVIGPLLQPTLNETSHCFLRLIKEGTCVVTPGGVLIFVDVRDVAEAHVLALEESSANGRYCVVAEVVFCSRVFNLLRQLYPSHTFPLGLRDCSSEETEGLNQFSLRWDYSSEENESGAPPLQVCNDKLKSLGLNFMSLEQSVKDTVESFIEKKFLDLGL